MKRRSKKILLSFVVALLVLAALGWSVADGRWPAANRWAEQRLVAALRGAGFTSSAVPLREISWQRAAAGPVELELPAVKFHVEQASATLGWAVWRKQGALDFAVRGARVTLDLARLDELRAWRTAHARTGGEDTRDFSFEVSDGVLELRHGELHREVGFAGSIRWVNGELTLESRVSAPELRAAVMLAAHGKLRIENGVAKPEAWRELLAAVAPGAGAALRPLSVDTLEFSGAADLSLEGIAGFDVTLLGRQAAWVEEAREIRSTEVRSSLRREGGGLSWGPVTAMDPAGRWGEWKLRARRATLENRGDAQSWRFDGAELTGAELSAQGDLELEGTWASGGLPQAAQARLGRARWQHGAFSWSADSLTADWQAGVLQVTLPRAELLAPRRGTLSAAKLTVRDAASEQPVAEGSAVLGGDGAAIFAVAGWELQPAAIEVPVTFVASLGRGQESVRATVKLGSSARRVRWPGGEVAGEAALTLTTTFDREFVSGRLSIEGRDWTVRLGERELTAAKGDLSIRWPRTWWSAVRDWAKQPRARVVREALWAGDVDVNFSEAQVSAATLGTWRGVSARARIRGAEFSAESGIDAGFSADEAEVAGIRIRDVQLQGVAGFDRARLELAGNPALVPVRVSGVQNAAWGDGLESAGEFAVPEFDLAAAGGLEAWLPWIAPIERSGKVSGSARTTWRDGKLAATAAVKLRDGVFAKSSLGARCEGVQAELKFASLAPLATDGLQKISFARATLSGVELSGGTIDVALLPTGRLRVGEAAFEAFGGRIQAGNFETPLDRLEVKTLVFASKLRLEEIAELFPSLPVRVAGPVNGAVPLEWNNGRMEIGSGVLDLIPGELATVHLPEDFQPLTTGKKPSEFGYFTLKKVEKAILELHANRLHVETYPANAKGQSVLIRMVGAPAGRFITAPVHLDFNVYAPLTDLVDWSRKVGASAEAAR